MLFYLKEKTKLPSAIGEVLCVTQFTIGRKKM